MFEWFRRLAVQRKPGAIIVYREVKHEERSEKNNQIYSMYECIILLPVLCRNREQGQPGAANSDSKSEAGAFDTGIA